MGITERSVANPAGVAVAVAIVSLLGFFSLTSLPIQLFPDIDQPLLSVQSNWRAASPREVESELLEPMEEVLQGLPGLQTMEANAFNGGAFIAMRFGLDTDMQAALMDVIGRLNRLPPLPADADPPIVQLGGDNANQSLTWFFVQKLPGTPGELSDYARQIEDIVKPRLEAIEGVAGVEVLAGAPDELQIVMDPYRAADLGLTLTGIAGNASQSNDVSGGFVDVGRRQYTLRFEGRYDPEQLRNQVLEWRDGRPVRLGDVAEIKVAHGTRSDIVVQNGNAAIGVRIDRQNGANVLEALDAIKAEVGRLREGPLKELGLGIEQSFDASVFIKRAVNLVTGDLFMGVLLSVAILWVFLRDVRGTVLIATAIPISLLSTFVVLQLTGRSLNVISLAGLAFAVGMVLDAAIVVSENIVRLRERGEVPVVAALKGTGQVKGALLASTATTVAIFLPVLFMQDVEGQLFADLALTISIAIVVSLLVAMTVLPAVAANWLKPQKLKRNPASKWAGITRALMKASSTPRRRVAVVIASLALPLLITWALFPQLDYLPPVKRDAVDAFLQTPPGANWEAKEKEIMPVLVERLKPYMDGTKEPALRNYYIWLFPNGGSIGARVLDNSRLEDLEKLMRDEIMVGIPDFRGFAVQGNLFGGFGGGGEIAMHLQSADEAGLMAAATAAQERLMEVFPGANVQAFPAPEQSEPELRIRPDDARIAEVGFDRKAIASIVRTLGNGLWLGEYFDGEQRMDIILKAEPWATPEDLSTTPVMTPAGEIVPLGELVDIDPTTGPAEIRRVNGRRTVTLLIGPPENVSLEATLAQLKTEVEPGIRASLPPDGSIVYAGSADKLQQAISSMGKNFVLALVVLFLLMAGMFRSMRDSALVVLTIPLGAVGGVIALRLLNLVSFQPMDLLTMIGFIILLGLVVNNAILLVDQTRAAEKEGMSRDEAVEHALKVRMRPIFMGTFTAIFGMLPLVLMPGAATIIYRGLATAIVGGMTTSLVFTLVMLPCLLRTGKVQDFSDAKARPAGVPKLKAVARNLVVCALISVSLSLFPQPGWAQIEAPAPVTVDKAKRDTYFASVWVAGTVVSQHDARIAAETDGRITWVAEAGTHIAAGESIARIDDADLQLMLRDNQAQLESLLAQQRYQENNLERLRQLAEKNNAAVNQLDEAQSQLEMTIQEVRRAEVAVAQTERRIEQTRVRSPFPAIVVERLIEVGEFVTRGAEVARLVDTENREIRAQAPLSVAAYVREGLEVSVEHENEESLSPVARVIPVGDEVSRMFEIRIAASNPAWVVGSPVRVALPSSDPRELVAIPRDALVLRGTNVFVLRVGNDNTVEKIKVDTGIGFGRMVEVIGNVSDGDRVVIRGAERLESGQAVVIAENKQS